MERKTPRWESELWSYLSNGDGIHCPMYLTCHMREDGVRCFSEDDGYSKLIKEFVDDDESELSDPASVKIQFSICPITGRIFQLVRRLANKLREESGIDHLPVPTNLITRAYDNLPIEVRQVPLKAYRGAVWRLSACWVVQLNSNDSPARQRFTLYHEIFHILVHRKATPVFNKAGCNREGSFNEMLADNFSGACLLPERWVKEKWTEVKDMSQMAAIFNVPKPIVWLALKHLSLI